MKPLPVIIGVIGIVGLGIGVAMAASPAKKTAEPDAIDAPGNDAQKALRAIATGNSETCKNTGLIVANASPVIAAGLVRVSQFLADIGSLPADVSALVRSSVMTTEPDQMAGVAAILQTRQYDALARDLYAVSGYVKWLRQGAPSNVDPASLVPVVSVLPAKPTSQTPVVKPSNELSESQINEIATVVKSGDVSRIRALADKYRATNPDVSLALDGVVIQIEAAKAKGESTIVTPSIPTTPSAPGAPSVPVASTKKLLAGKVAIAFQTAKRTKNAKGQLGETQPASAVELARQFQEQENLSRKDGAYGSETALSLAKTYGIAPPTPLYWGKKNGAYTDFLNDKKRYNAELEKLAASDLARKDEWLAARVRVQ